MKSFTNLFLTLVLAGPLYSQAGVIDFHFAGICDIDCSGTANAVLTVMDDYELGTDLELADLVAFSYDAPDSAIVALFGSVFTEADDFVYVLGGLPIGLGLADLSFGARNTATGDGYTFQTTINSPPLPVGYWLLLSGIDDIGNAGTWSVPEPATLVLFGVGLAGLGWSRRKQHS